MTLDYFVLSLLWHLKLSTEVGVTGQQQAEELKPYTLGFALERRAVSAFPLPSGAGLGDNILSAEIP